MKVFTPLLLALATFSPMLSGQTSAAAQGGSAGARPAAAGPTPESTPPEAAAAPGGVVRLPPEKAEPVTLRRFEEPPVIDGRLEEPAWQSAALLKDFYQTQPGDNIAPSHPTEVLLGYDSRFLYIAFRAHDEPGKVRATIAKRDNVTEDDNVRLILDTFGDGRRAYIFIFNPFGVQQDGILTEGGGEDYSVDVVMQSQGALNPEGGYVVEAAIPFKSLRYRAGSDTAWRAHAFRRIKRFNNELDSWMPISRSNSSLLDQAGRLAGLEGVAGERTLEFIPSLTLSETGRRVRGLPPRADQGRFVNQPLEFDPGLTVKLGIASSVTLDVAINPDFAQVEADQVVVTANQRFPIFFEEKRPFFLEGVEIFQTSLSPVHTRAIVDPDYAAKLTGKLGRNTFGLLVASDNAPGNFRGDERLDPDNFRFLDKNALIGVLRLKRDVGKESTLGLLATTYNFVERHNHLGGFDGRFRLSPKSVFEFQALGTTSRRFFFDPSEGRSAYRTGNGFGYHLNYNHTDRNASFNINAQGRTRDYRADVGFTRRTNTNSLGTFLSYNSDPKPKAGFVSWRVFNASSAQFDWQGRSQRFDSETQAYFSFRHQAFVGVGFIGGYERLFEEEFGPTRSALARLTAERFPSLAGVLPACDPFGTLPPPLADDPAGTAGEALRLPACTFAGLDPERSTYRKLPYIYGGITPSQKYSFFVNLTRAWGDFDFDFGAGPRFPRVSPGALRDPDAPRDPGPGRSLNLFTSFTYQPTQAFRNTVSYTKSRLTRYDTGRVAFDADIVALRSTYQFTRFTFARARLDYDTLFSNVRGQFLLGWTPNPGTSLYAGYNDDLSYNGFSPFNGRPEPGFRRNGRVFFIKMSYLFRRSL